MFPRGCRDGGDEALAEAVTGAEAAKQWPLREGLMRRRLDEPPHDLEVWLVVFCIAVLETVVLLALGRWR